jgi:hypothetical protein
VRQALSPALRSLDELLRQLPLEQLPRCLDELRGTVARLRDDVAEFVGRRAPTGQQAITNPSRLLQGLPAVVLNRRGVPYPTIIDPRTGQAVSFPSTIVRTPAASRVAWGPAERQAFIAEWRRRGFADPPGGWGNYDIHHITPREWGGTNAFENLVPVERTVHQQTVTPWWNNFSGR